MGHPLHHTPHGGTAPARTGLGHAVIAPYDAYPTADGGRVLLSVQNDREWRRLVEQVLGRPELTDDSAFATNPARVARRERTDEPATAALGALDTDTALERLQAAGIACARPRDVTEVAEHPQRGRGTEESGARARGAHRFAAPCRGDDGRRDRSVAPGRCGRLNAGLCGKGP